MTDTAAGDRRILVLRVEAPLLAWGDVAPDAKRPTREHPYRSQLTGLLANALGWLHGDWQKLDRLQERLVYAVRRDRQGRLVKDYHTVDLGQDFMLQGWTTRHAPEGRGGAFSTGTHIRDRHFLADAAYTVALGLDPADEEPTVDDLRDALAAPARPLFFGRKACLPSRPLVGHKGWAEKGWGDLVDAPSPIAALARIPDWSEDPPATKPLAMTAWWSDDQKGGPAADRQFPIYEDRDWRNQIHAGRRIMNEGSIEPTAVEPGGAADA